MSRPIRRTIFACARLIRNATAFASIVAMTLLAPGARATPGDVDATFGAGLGKLLLPFSAGDDLAPGLALLPGGRFLAHGTCAAANGIDAEYCIARLNGNGSLDTTFASAGKLSASFAAINRKAGNAARRMVIQTSGKMVVAAACISANANAYELCLARHHENGALDTRFGNNGYSVFTLGGASLASIDLAAQPDGKLVVGLRCNPTANGSLSYFCVARFDVDGLPDTNYGDGGIKITQLSADASPRALAIDSAGRAILAGSCRNTISSAWQYCLVRHLTNGQRDTTFGTQGVVRQAVGFGSDAALSDVLVQPDGRILVGGRCRAGTLLWLEFCIVRFLSSGAVDNAIGAAALIFTSGAARGSAIVALHALPNGQLLLGGDCYTNPANFDADFCVTRIHEDGARDTSFGNNGQIIAAIGSKSDSLSAIAYTHDGKILVGGACEGAVNYEFCFAKLQGGPYAETRCSADLDGDGRIVATIDGLIAQRVMLGVTGAPALAGVAFPAGTTRTTWTAIREFLVSQCGMRIKP